MSKDQTVEMQHALIGNRETAGGGFEVNRHPDTAWWDKTCLGLFIHWGISAVCGMNDLSWGMMRAQPHSYEGGEPTWGLAAHTSCEPPREYWKQAERFSAEHYDPDKWLRAAKEAGFQYAILTTKHHDGFALWPSEYGDFNTKNYLQGRDLVGEFVTACRKNGLRVGLYYSPPDWRVEQDYMSFARDEEVGIDFEPRAPKKRTPQFDAEERAYRRGQITELLTRYGKIDMLWFDGSCDMAVTPEEVRALQPGILCNNRGWGYGDFVCPECRFPDQRPEGRFQYIHCLSDGGWGYNDYEIYRPAGWMIGEFGKARAWGGHFVANVGPKADGTLPDVYYYRMRQIGEWIEKYGETLFDVQGGPWPERSNVPVTIRDGEWFVLPDWRVDYPIEIRDVGEPASLTLYDGTPLEYVYRDGALTFQIPWKYKHNYTDPVRLRFK